MTLPENYFDWLELQPERIKLVETKNKFEKAYRHQDIEARQLMFKCISVFGCSEKLDSAKTEFECSSEHEDETMEKIYGIHPETIVSGQDDAVATLQQQAYKLASQATQAFDEARLKEAAFNAAREELSIQYDSLKKTYDELKTKQTQSND
jgi:hypothetical protein